MAGLHPAPGMVWRQTSPTAAHLDGPVLYQIIFRSSATPGNVPVISPTFTLTNSPIGVSSGNVVIGGGSGLRINGATGIVTFANGQIFPGTTGVNSVTAGNGFITIGGTGANPTVGLNTAISDARYLQLTGGTMTGNITFAAGQTFPGLGSLAGEVTGPANSTVVSNAVSANANNAIVRRDGTGSFSAGTVSLSGNLALANTASATAGVLTFGGTPFLQNFGINNTFVGANAGNTTTTGNYNTFVGASAGNTSTGFSYNTGVGYLALHANTGQYNNAVGAFALNNNAGGCSNNAFGANALLSNTGSSQCGSGNDNSAFGASALQSNTSGNFNIAVGDTAGGSLTNGSNNI